MVVNAIADLDITLTQIVTAMQTAAPAIDLNPIVVRLGAIAAALQRGGVNLGPLVAAMTSRNTDFPPAALDLPPIPALPVYTVDNALTDVAAAIAKMPHVSQG